MILALSGPSCIGKTYAKEAILKVHPEVKELHAISTGEKRVIDGSSEHVSYAEFMKLEKSGELACVFESNGKKYGFKKTELQKREDDYIVILPSNLISEAKKINPNIVSINFVIKNEELGLLRQRMRKHYSSMTSGEIDGKIMKAKAEMRDAREDYLTYDVTVLVSKEYEYHFDKIVISLYDNFAKKK